MTEDLTRMTAALSEFLATMLQEGFVLPFTMAAIAANGSVYVIRYGQGETGLVPTHLAEHVDGQGFKTPVNLVLVDSRGEAARMVVRPDGGRSILH